MTDLELKYFNKELEKLGFLGFGGGNKPKPDGPPGFIKSVTDPLKSSMSPKTRKVFSTIKRGLGAMVAPAFVAWEASAARKSVLGGGSLIEGMPSAKQLSQNLRR